MAPVRELARTLLSFAATRTRLAATELEEQAVRLTEILAWLAIAYFFLGAALVFLAIVIVLLVGQEHRPVAAALIALVFLAVGAGGAVLARRRMRERPGFLAATLAELERDRERIGMP
jgi:uncharacterized membrane protein YqjE